MITTLPPETARPATPIGTNGSGQALRTTVAADYRLLGLRPREARVEVIREAVHQAASQIQLDAAVSSLVAAEAPEDSAEDHQQRLAEIAIAGYRLLDPRRRRTLFERVQLLMWTEEELDTTIKSLWAGQPIAPPKVKIALRNPKKDVAPSHHSSQDEQRAALELFQTMRRQDRRAVALWVGLAGLTVSLTLSLAIFAWLA